MSGQRDLHDHFFREAKRNGFRSRAAYKLIEIDDKRQVFSKGDSVLDLGAAPGSWLQVAATAVGKKGRVVGVDLKEIEGQLPENVVTIREDVTTMTPESIGIAPGANGAMEFQVILSDMAPNTTGNRTVDHHGSVKLCHTAIDLAATMLVPSGNLVMKVLEGEAYKDLLDRAGTYFDFARGFKPKASRAISTEMFVVCKDRYEKVPPPTVTFKSPPTSGWG